MKTCIFTIRHIFKRVIKGAATSDKHFHQFMLCFYRVREFWAEQGPAEVLAKLQRKEITLFRAAEMLNVTVTTLANYLSTLRPSGEVQPDLEEEAYDDRIADSRQELHSSDLLILSNGTGAEH